MPSDAPSTILLRVNDIERRIFEELADVALTPGEFLEFEANGNLGPEGTVGAGGLPMVCVEKPYIDPGIVTTKAIDTDWSVGESARYIIPQRGDIVYAFLAAGQNVAKGASLQGDGAGALQALAAGTVKGYAAEAVDNSGGGTRIRIKLIVA